ncbi:unnamed protein product [Owenia fusiformis]|uniref:Dendritic cell-specific transmembrane protein-like domain-containing protein n=1 Tax=Owenia fusiformis TaxID=6347 RepID=A0A8S4NP47_OWEFU|nr:unnamed protein product [Owenia fusiformis]
MGRVRDIVKFMLCIALLTIPGIIVYPGRVCLVKAMINLLINGPIKNILENAKKIPNGISCQVEKIKEVKMDNQTAILDEYRKEAMKRMISLPIEMLETVADVPKQAIENVFSQLNFVKINISDIKINTTITLHNVTFDLNDVQGYTNGVNVFDNIERPNIMGIDTLVTIIGKMSAIFENQMELRDAIQQILPNMLNCVLYVLLGLVILHAGFYFCYYLLQSDYHNTILHRIGRCVLVQECLMTFKGLLIILVLMVGVMQLLDKLDSLFYQALETIRQESNITISIDVGSGLNVVLNDTNPHISKLLHQQVPMLFTNDSFNYKLEINTESCLSDPSPPFHEKIADRVGLITITSVIAILTILQLFVGKIQHAIAEYFYPKKEDHAKITKKLKGACLERVMNKIGMLIEDNDGAAEQSIEGEVHESSPLETFH